MIAARNENRYNKAVKMHQFPGAGPDDENIYK